jgi:hypothetical protein
MVMKKRGLFVLALAALLAVLAPLACLAQQTQVDVYQGGRKVRSVVFVVGLKEYFVNGQTPGIKTDAAPYTDQGRTFVPVRYLAYGLGVAEKDVGWAERTRTVTLKLGDRTAELVIGSKVLKASGRAQAMDVAPQLKSGRTYLPARWVAEALGYQVDWDPQDRLVVCWPKGEPKPQGDIARVKQYAPGGKAANAGLPANAVLVGSVADFKAPVVDIDESYLKYEKVYQAEATVSQFPVPCEELGYVYKLEIDRAKFTQYDQPAVKVTVDNGKSVDLVIVANGGRDVRYRQLETDGQTADGKWVLYYCANETKDRNLGDSPAKPLLKPEDVEWFGISTAWLGEDGKSLVLWIKNPYKSG